MDMYAQRNANWLEFSLSQNGKTLAYPHTLYWCTLTHIHIHTHTIDEGEIHTYRVVHAIMKCVEVGSSATDG